MEALFKLQGYANSVRNFPSTLFQNLKNLSLVFGISDNGKDFIWERGTDFEGDMVLKKGQKDLRPHAFSGIIGDHHRWRLGRVIVNIDPGFSEKNLIINY